jgi:O-antigen ligase
MLREWQQSRGLYPDYRPGYVVGDANYFGVSAVICIPLACCLLPVLKPGFQQFLCMGSLVATVAAFILASSRGGLLGLVAAWALMLFRLGRKSRNFVIATCLMIPPLFLLPMSPVLRLLHPTYFDNAAAETRTTLWKIGFNLIREHPVFGVGLGNFRSLTSNLPDGARQHVAHNSYIEIAAEMGIPAMMVFLALLVAAVMSLGRVRRLARQSQQVDIWRAAIGMECALVGAAVGIFFISGQYQKLYWFMLSASACLPQFVRRPNRKRELASRVSDATLEPLEVGYRP